MDNINGESAELPAWTGAFSAAFVDALAKALSNKQGAATASAAAPDDGAPLSNTTGQSGPAALLKDPPLFEAKLTHNAFMTWRDKFLLFSRRGGRTSAESAIASGNAYTLRAYWFGARESLRDIPTYDAAKAQVESDLSLANQETWLQWLEQVIRFNTCETEPVRPKFDSFSLKWVDESNLDLEDLAAATRLRVQNAETYDTEDHFQASVLDFRRVLELNGFRTLSSDLSNYLSTQLTAPMSSAQRGDLLKSLMETYEYRLHQALKIIRDHKVWLPSSTADSVFQRPPAVAAAISQPQRKPKPKTSHKEGEAKAERTSRTLVQKNKKDKATNKRKLASTLVAAASQ